MRNVPNNMNSQSACRLACANLLLWFLHRVDHGFHRGLRRGLQCGFAGLLAALLFATTVQAAEPAPSTDYQPADVIRIVVDALRTNDTDDTDSGIATVFRFASPGNRNHTGPLDRFATMIKKGFSDMLNHVNSRFDDIEVNDGIAMQSVWLTTFDGKEVGYLFRLSRQQGGDYDGMWMTDGVLPLGEGEFSGKSI